MESTIVITSSELVEHSTLARKKTEAEFRRDFLLRKGAKEEDEHVVALTRQMEQLEQRYAPIDEKIRKVDLLTIVPNRAEILALSAEISQHSKQVLDEVMHSKEGEVYELLKKRAQYTKSNYDNRESIAKLTILLNMLDRSEAEKLRTVIESNATDVVEVGALNPGQQQEMVSQMGRIGIGAYVSGGKLCMDKKKFDAEPVIQYAQEKQKRLFDTFETVWVPAEREAAFDENEKSLEQASRRIQILMTKSHADPLDEKESAEFQRLQMKYIDLKQKRADLCAGAQHISAEFASREPPKNAQPPAYPAQ